MAQCLHFQAHLPLEFCSDYVLTSTYLIHRIPFSSIQSQTPFEHFFNQTPRCNHLRVFGCLCYAQTITSHQDTFQPYGNPCIFLGYPPNHRGYCLYNLKHTKIIISRNMTFVEHIILFQSHTPPTHHSLVLPLPILDTTSSSYPHITFEPDLPHSPSPPPPPLHLHRTINGPSHLHDYLCPTLPSSTALSTHSNTSSDMAHPLSYFISYSKFPPTHYVF